MKNNIYCYRCSAFVRAPRDTNACAIRRNTSADKTVASHVIFFSHLTLRVWPDAVCSKGPRIIVTLIEPQRSNKIVDENGCSFMKKIENNSGFFHVLLAMTFCTTYINTRLYIMRAKALKILERTQWATVI